MTLPSIVVSTLSEPFFWVLSPASNAFVNEPRPYPTLVIRRRPASIFDYEFEDFAVEGYDPHPAIKAPVAV